jgi:hypothetical protein
METAATILYADLDAFYASVEQLPDPSDTAWSRWNLLVPFRMNFANLQKRTFRRGKVRPPTAECRPREAVPCSARYARSSVSPCMRRVGGYDNRIIRSAFVLVVGHPTQIRSWKIKTDSSTAMHVQRHSGNLASE